MKFFNLFLFLIIILFFVHCKKLNKEKFGFLNATFNSTEWDSFGLFSMSEDFTVYSEKKEDKNNSQHLVILNIKRNKNKQIIFPKIAMLKRMTAQLALNHTDTGCGWFDIDTTDTFEDYFVITRELNDFKEVWGEFQLSLHGTSECGKALGLPENVKFEKGKFHLFLQ